MNAIEEKRLLAMAYKLKLAGRNAEANAILDHITSSKQPRAARPARNPNDARFMGSLVRQRDGSYRGM